MAVACTALAVAQSASAVVITFEGFANTIYNAPITRSGFDIGNPAGQLQHFHEFDSNCCPLPSNGMGVLLDDRNTDIFVEVNGGGTFTLTQVDAASSGGRNSGGLGIDIRVYLNNVLVGTVSVANLGGGYATLLGDALGTVDRLSSTARDSTAALSSTT
jgi:hypothetical protein